MPLDMDAASADAASTDVTSADVTLRARTGIDLTAQKIRLDTTRLRAWLPPLFLFFASLVIVWQYDPLHRSVFQDPGIFAYLSQLVAQGFAPHKYAFNEQASLAFFLGGAAMRVGDLFGLHHLVSFRLASMLVLAVVVALTYRVTGMFTRSRAAAFLAGLIMLGYHGYNLRAASALEPKSVMLVFGLLTLLFLSKRNWWLAGALASAAGLAYQIAWGYLLVVVLLAAVQGGATWKERARAVGLALVPALGVFAVYALYFASQNALTEMLQQTFLAPVIMHEIANKSFDARIFKLAKTFSIGFVTHSAFGLLGVAGLLTWLGARLATSNARALLRRALYFFLRNRRTAGTLLVTLGFMAYSFLDFQNYPDWFPLLPFISLFAAWLLYAVGVRLFRSLHVSHTIQRGAFIAVAFLILASGTWHAFLPMGGAPTRDTWQDQQRVAHDLAQRLGPATPIWLLGKAEVLFFMQRLNLNKYIYLFGNVDAAAEAFEPGGFRAMVNDALAHKPVLYTIARATPKKFSTKANAEFMNRTGAKFVLLKRCHTLGGGRFYVRPDRANALFPRGAPGCLERR